MPKHWLLLYGQKTLGTFLKYLLCSTEEKRKKNTHKSVEYAPLNIIQQMKSSSDREKPHCAVWCGQVKLLERRRAWISVSDKKDFRSCSPASPHFLSAPQTPFPSLHRNEASHQASLLPSPCGFHLNARTCTQPTLSNTEKLVRCFSKTVNFLGCSSLFYSSFVKNFGICV